MKNIKDIASGDKFVQWESLAGPIDENFAELGEYKLSKNGLAQTTGNSTTNAMSQDAVTKELAKKLSTGNLAQGTGSSTSTAMSQDAVTKELEKRKEYEEYTRKALTGQEETATANDYPFIRIDIENSDGSGWNTLNEKLNDINTIATPKYNGWVRYFLSGQAIDVVNRVLFFGNKTTSQVATGPLMISNGKLAYSGDVDKSFARIYKGSSWSPWKPLNSEDSGISSSFYKTPLDLEAVDEGSPLSSSDMEKILLMQDALNEGQTIISSVGVLNASIVYRVPSYIINISYIKGSEMRILSATAPRAGGTWHAQNIDLSIQSGSGGGGISDVSGSSIYGRKQGLWTDISPYVTNIFDKYNNITGPDDENNIVAVLAETLILKRAQADGRPIYTTFPYNTGIAFYGKYLPVYIDQNGTDPNNLSINAVYLGLNSSLETNNSFICISLIVNISNRTVELKKYEGSIIPEAPADGNTYGRRNKGWEKITSTSGSLEDVTTGLGSGFSYERINGAWVARSYYTGCNIGKILSVNSTGNLPEALGDFSDFMQAVEQGLNIFCVEYYNNKTARDYKVHIPIYYKYDPTADIKTIELSWTVGTITTTIVVDITDGWGDILDFKRVDIASLERPYVVHIVTALNNGSGIDNVNSPNRIEVRLDRELQEGYSLALLRRKKVSYWHNNGRVRKKGIGYRLVTAKQGFASSGLFRDRSGFIAKLKFYYDETNQWYRLVDDTGAAVTPFDFALHYTEVRDGVLRVSCAGKESKSLYEFSNPDFGGKRLKYKMQFGIAVIKYQHGDKVDGGYVVCSNIAKMEFSFSNMAGDTELDPVVDAELELGFRVHVIN